MLSVTADIAWARSVMAMVRSMIVRSTYEGVETQIGALDQAISAHLGETPKPPGTDQTLARECYLTDHAI
jgi:hypothetical protein